MLHKLQDEKGLYLANKIRRRHTQWQYHKMKVNIAAQALSASEADTLEFLCKDLELEESRDVMPTVEFIRKINDVFDILNSRNVYHKGMRTPLKVANENYWTPRTEDTLLYLSKLKSLDGQLLYKTKQECPIIGFIISTKSLLQIFNEEVKTKKSLDYILIYKFSQDHFNGVRSYNGSNNSPSCLQFYWTYRRMLMHAYWQLHITGCDYQYWN